MGMSINSQRPAGEEMATVLVVEDDPALRMLCRVNLELENYRVLEAGSIDLADELLTQEQINLVLLDLHVGSRDGRELVPVIRSKQPDASICLLSGTSMSDPPLDAGADVFRRTVERLCPNVVEH
jgi:DNA-binding response OmpR family regulator